jgi:hypothetical protein
MFTKLEKTYNIKDPGLDKNLVESFNLLFYAWEQF